MPFTSNLCRKQAKIGIVFAPSQVVGVLPGGKGALEEGNQCTTGRTGAWGSGGPGTEPQGATAKWLLSPSHAWVPC